MAVLTFSHDYQALLLLIWSPYNHVSMSMFYMFYNLPQ